jgi:uncharacterized protein (TIGR04255 family)
MPADFLYRNPPLVEVIAEVRWKLQPLQSLPNAAIDPHFSALASDLTSLLAAEGFQVVETLVPAEVPIELLPNRVVKRFRQAADRWPVFQVGPGVFTVNVVPPYKGWAEFRTILAHGVDLLFKSYPLPEKYLTVSETRLKYVDAFSTKHTYVELLPFIRDHFSIQIDLPDEIIESATEQKAITLSSTISFPLRERSSSSGIIKIASGKHHGADAAILELTALDKECGSSPEAIIEWTDFAHSMVRRWFQIIANDKLKQLMGPIHEIGT